MVQNTPPHTDIKRLCDLLRVTGKNYDIAKIQKAYEYAYKLHEGQYRASGEMYISHPVAVAEIVAGLELDTDSICAALLHDTVENWFRGPPIWLLSLTIISRAPPSGSMMPKASLPKK